MHTLLRGKLGLGVKYQVFLGKNGFGVKNQLFPRKKGWFWEGKPTVSLVYAKEHQLFPRENQQKQNTSFGKVYGQTPTRLFFGFSLGKGWFWAENPTFS